MKGCHWIIQSQRRHPFSLLNILCQNQDPDVHDGEGNVNDNDNDGDGDGDGDDNGEAGVVRDKWISRSRTGRALDRNASRPLWIATCKSS